jgi:hypothetical protein
MWISIQRSAKTPPLIPVYVEAKDFDKFMLDIIDPEDWHLLQSKLVIVRLSNWLFYGRRLALVM